MSTKQKTENIEDELKSKRNVMVIELDVPKDIEVLYNVLRAISSRKRLKILYVLQTGKEYTFFEIAQKVGTTVQEVREDIGLMSRVGIIETRMRNIEHRRSFMVVRLKAKGIYIDLTGLQ